MADFVAGVFALIVVLVLAGGIVGTIAPSLVQFRRGEPPTRKRVAGFAAGIFVVALIGLAITVPDPTPEQRAQMEADAKARAANEAAAEAKAKDDATASRRREIEALWNEITDTDGLCSESAQAVGELDPNDRYAAYGRIQEAMQACKMAHYAMREIAPPKSLTGEHRDNFENAIGKCADASLARQMMFEAMSTVVDGDIRPSAVQAVREAGETGQALGIQCAASFVHAANEIGVEVGDYIK